MVLSCVGRKHDIKRPFNQEQIAAIKAAIKANPKFKALDKAGFCFIPPNGKKASGTPCGCVHGKTHYKP